MSTRVVLFMGNKLPCKTRIPVSNLCTCCDLFVNEKEVSGRFGEASPMPVKSPFITTGLEGAVLERGALRIELALRPFSFTVRRAGRRLLRAGDVWVADGTVMDRFIQFTEGVVAHEDLEPP